jgi:hypothetical protein
MKKSKIKFEKINLHGFDIEYSEDTVKVYMRDEIAEHDYKATTNKLITYLQDESFIERKAINVEIKVYEN